MFALMGDCIDWIEIDKGTVHTNEGTHVSLLSILMITIITEQRTHVSLWGCWWYNEL